MKALLLLGRERAAWLLVALLAACVANPAAVQAQAIERHPATLPNGTGSGVSLPEVTIIHDDTTPVVAALQSIVLLGPQEGVHDASLPGITIGAVPRLQSPRTRSAIIRRLVPYLGQPLSLDLIERIKATVAMYFRGLNYPFVSLSTPEQEISDGALQIRVVEFTAGTVTVDGVDAAEADAIRDRIGLRPGDAINSDDLIEDLYWINTYPFRQVQAVFSPGASFAASDLTLAATSKHPWQVYFGYETTTGPGSGASPERYYAGGVVGGLVGRDSVLAAQATISPDAVSSFDSAAYEGFYANYVLPVGPHGQFEMDADVVRTNQDVADFTESTQLAEASAGYRIGMPVPFGIGGLADTRFGLEGSVQHSTTSFGGTTIHDAMLEVYQLYFGLHYVASDKPDAAGWDVSVHVSPGNVDDGNGAARAVDYTQGRVQSMTYAYLDASYRGQISLPLDVTLATQIVGQYSPFPLPPAVQQGIGDETLVRGYNSGEGSFDTQLVLRNELHAPAIGSDITRLDPYLFADAGYGRDAASGAQDAIASIGIGADLRLLDVLTLKIDLADALLQGVAAAPGDWSVHVQTGGSF